MAPVFFVLLFSYLLLFTFGENELLMNRNFVPSTCDRKTSKGDLIAVHYTGYIDQSSMTGNKGSVFDSSRQSKRAFFYKLGSGKVIPGWEEGMLDMCLGEKRTLVVPPELAYGSTGAGKNIPPGATLRFEVECVQIGDMTLPPKRNVFSEMDTDNDRIIIFEEFSYWFVKEGLHKNVNVRDKFYLEDKNQVRPFVFRGYGSRRAKVGEDALDLISFISRLQDGAIQFEEFSGPKVDLPATPTLNVGVVGTTEL